MTFHKNKSSKKRKKNLSLQCRKKLGNISLNLLNVKKATWKCLSVLFLVKATSINCIHLKKNKVDGVIEGKKENNKARKESKRK